MIIRSLTFRDLDLYHNSIPMIKEGDSRVSFNNDSTLSHTRITPYSIDMREHEKTSLWKKILSEDNTQINIIEENGQFVAGAITVTHSPDCNMLRNDMTNAVLWDIRVHPSFQQKGYASLLLNKSIKFSKSKNCAQLLIETQDNNPKAIQFYLKHGAKLYDKNISVYPDELNEIQFIFSISTKIN